jgi:hypothetical protein
MAKDRFANAVAGLVGDVLAEELASDFRKIRQDLVTRTLERASPGKFVETFVQCLQQISAGSYSAKPGVDRYLRDVEGDTKLPEGLRICGARIARAVYTLRNKRNIAHKSEIDPNSIDLRFCYDGARWIMSELVRQASGVTMQEAAAVIDLIQAPVGALVEEIDGTRLVHADVPIRTEILILLHSYYPDPVFLAEIMKSLEARNASAVRKQIAELRKGKHIYGDPKNGYRLTQPGHRVATEKIVEEMEAGHAK